MLALAFVDMSTDESVVLLIVSKTMRDIAALIDTYSDLLTRMVGGPRSAPRPGSLFLLLEKRVPACTMLIVGW